MKIVTLVENSCKDETYGCEHGLSFYIETEQHKLFLVTGASDLFLSNARKLNIDLRQVDTVILSHGHYDHGGGILKFGEINPHAKIYMQKNALDDYYHGERYIGIDKEIAQLPQVQLLDGDCVIDNELSLFSNITGRLFWPKSNLELKKQVGEREMQDDFSHEQCLVISQKEGNYLLSGCAHNGILNILDQYRKLYGGNPLAVISGFHMMKKTEYTEEERKVIEDTAKELKKTDTVFYTGHCTGRKAFELMKPIMGDKLMAIWSGMVWDFGYSC